MAVSVVAGLGNPGTAYEDTRHNAGFMLLDALAGEFGCSWARDRKFDAWVAAHHWHGRRLYLVKPRTYVNRSGSCLNGFCGYYKLAASSMVVVYDEINLTIGRAKISIGGSAGGHNGVADILRYFPNEFIRFRIGIGPKHPPEMELKDYVLGKLTARETEALSGNMKGFLDGVKLLIDTGPQAAMNRVNQRPRENTEADETRPTNREQETEHEDDREKKIPGHGDSGHAGA